ncbi:MAG TPA: PepSY domain-containing protein [Longimicrobiales bacterium]
MKNLLSTLLVATLLPAGAAALSAQQPQYPTTEHAKQTTTHHTRRHHKQHSTKSSTRHHAATMERHHARTTSMRMNHEVGTTRTSTYTAPAVLGRAIGPNNPSGVGSGGTLQRLSSGLITPDAARTIALGRIPGGTSVDKIRLRTEDGRQVYDVKVVTPNQTGNEMVRVDAHTGAVLETKNVDNPVGSVKGAVDKAVDKVKHH